MRRMSNRMYEIHLLKEINRDFDGDMYRANVEILKYRQEQNRYEVD